MAGSLNVYLHCISFDCFAASAFVAGSVRFWRSVRQWLMNTSTSSSPQTITLGGGCFWCTEAVYKDVKGVLDVESGYCNGHVKNPSYEDVCTGQTGHNEVVKLVYDPAVISTREILEIFFVVHDCTQLNRQGNDTGTQYRSGIYFSTAEQHDAANDIIREMSQDKIFGSPIVTEVLPLQNYSAAEAYHQDFFERNPYQGYCMAVAAPKVAKFRKTFARLAK
jgi:peptide-methionine (S)-S-oxide reductase